MAKNHCSVGLDQWCRDNDGEIRQKRGDTLIKTLRKRTGRILHPESAATRGLIRCAHAQAGNHCRSL
jgi:hypothetical protein